MTELSGRPGFVPRADTSLSKGRALALELVATVALTVSLVVAATAVSLGNKSLNRGGNIPQAASVSLPLQR